MKYFVDVIVNLVNSELKYFGGLVRVIVWVGG